MVVYDYFDKVSICHLQLNKSARTMCERFEIWLLSRHSSYSSEKRRLFQNVAITPYMSSLSPFSHFWVLHKVNNCAGCTSLSP